jgi:cytochrome c1
MLKCVNLIEIRLYASSFLVLWHIIFEISFHNLSFQRSFLQYKSQCLEKVNVKYVIKRLDVDIWMEIPIQHDVYIWANYSVLSYLNCIPICWNVLIWLKYDLLRIYFRNLSVQRSVLQYQSQCLKKVNVKYVINRLWHGIFHIVPPDDYREIANFNQFKNSLQSIRAISVNAMPVSSFNII